MKVTMTFGNKEVDERIIPQEVQFCDHNHLVLERGKIRYQS